MDDSDEDDMLVYVGSDDEKDDDGDCSGPWHHYSTDVTAFSCPGDHCTGKFLIKCVQLVQEFYEGYFVLGCVLPACCPRHGSIRENDVIDITRGIIHGPDNMNETQSEIMRDVVERHIAGFYAKAVQRKRQ